MKWSREISSHRLLAWATSALDSKASLPTALKILPHSQWFAVEILYLTTFSWNGHILLMGFTLNKISSCFCP